MDVPSPSDLEGQQLDDELEAWEQEDPEDVACPFVIVDGDTTTWKCHNRIRKGIGPGYKEGKP